MEFQTSEDAVEDEREGRRHALAKLLQRRGADQAAAIVALSHYRADWTGDGWVVTLSVPAELYDDARGRFSDVIRDGCIAIVGTDDFDGVDFRVKTPEYVREAEWIDVIVRSLDRQWVPSERVVASDAIGT